MPEWNGEERREYHRTIHDVEAAFNRALLEHEVRERENVDKLVEQLKHDMVPNGNTYHHREYHQRKIDAAKAEEQFWITAKGELFKRGLSAFLTVVAVVIGLAVTGFLYKLGIKL